MTKKKTDEYSRLLKKYKQLAKRADQRLVRLEQLSGVKGFKSVLKYAYKKAMKNIQSWSGQKANRFNTKPPTDLKQLRKKISDIEEFLSKKTSTKRGIMSVYRKRAKTLNSRYGTKFTWEDLGKFFESPEFEKYGNDQTGYGSKTYVMAVGELQNNEKDLIKAIKNHEPINLDIEDEKVNEAVNDLIGRYGVDFKKLYK